jgi:hypothetical protein
MSLPPFLADTIESTNNARMLKEVGSSAHVVFFSRLKLVVKRDCGRCIMGWKKYTNIILEVSTRISWKDPL